MTPSNEPLQKLAQRADTEVTAQEARSEAVAAKAEAARQNSGFKRALLAVFMLACIASLALQWRALREPFQTASPGESVAVAEGDLRAIAVFVDAFQLSQGRYPENLGEVRLPEGIAAMVRDHGVRYERTAADYRLLWALPAQQVVFDGANDEARVTPLNKP